VSQVRQLFLKSAQAKTFTMCAPWRYTVTAARCPSRKSTRPPISQPWREKSATGGEDRVRRQPRLDGVAIA
jgi:hypothetical protein